MNVTWLCWCGMSTLVQVMAWWRQARSHYLSQYWPRYMSPYFVTSSQWIKLAWWYDMQNITCKLFQWQYEEYCQTICDNAFAHQTMITYCKLDHRKCRLQNVSHFIQAYLTNYRKCHSMTPSCQLHYENPLILKSVAPVIPSYQQRRGKWGDPSHIYCHKWTFR